MQRVTEQIVTGLVVLGLLILSPLVCSMVFPVQAHQIYNNTMQALGDVGRAVAIGAVLLFFTGLVLGVAWALIKLNNSRKVQVIGHTKHGPSQAVIHNGVLIQLTAPMLGAAQGNQITQVKEIIQAAELMARYARHMPELQQPQGQQLLEAPEGIPDVIRYADVADEVPEEMSLLGIHPKNGDLELTNWEKLKMVWLVGSSSTGKSNTIFGKALEAVNKRAKLVVVDQHIVKADSLGKKLAPLAHAFLRKIAVSDQEVLDTLSWFQSEFERRVSCPICAQGVQCERCSQKVVLICDEMNRMVRNEALKKPLQDIVAICGEESRGFGMYGWFLSQKCAHLKWLRDSAITVIVHRLTRFEEALLACNDDRDAAKKLLKFKVGRTYIYGVDFEEPVELQQPLYEVDESKVVESDPSEVRSNMESVSSSLDGTVPPDGKVLDRTFPIDLIKLKKIRELIAKETQQQDIVCEVWGVQPSTRAFHEAVKEYRRMLAYLASVASADGGE